MLPPQAGGGEGPLAQPCTGIEGDQGGFLGEMAEEGAPESLGSWFHSSVLFFKEKFAKNAGSPGKLRFFGRFGPFSARKFCTSSGLYSQPIQPGVQKLFQKGIAHASVTIILRLFLFKITKFLEFFESEPNRSLSVLHFSA